MKSKRFLAMLLSIAMVLSSWSLFVFADENDAPDGEVTSGDVSDPGDSLDALTLGEFYEKPDLGFGEEYSVTFTPDQDGDYTLISSNAYKGTVGVYDEAGTSVPPVTSYSYTWTQVVNLHLNEGRTYTIKVGASYYDYEKPFTMIMIPTLKTMSVGKNTFFARGNQYTYYSFTPEESGTYMFDVGYQGFRQDFYSGTMEVKLGDSIVSRNVSHWGTQKNQYLANLTAGKTYSIKVYSYDSSYFGSVMNVNIRKGLPALEETVSNTISIDSDLKTQFYSFTPSKTGVYSFYSEGGYETAIQVMSYDPETGVYRENSAGSGGEGKNFQLPLCLRQGETYFVRFSATFGDGDDVISYPVFVKYEEPRGTGYYDSPAEPRERAFYAFRPDESGCYMFLCPNGYVTVDTYLDIDFSSGDPRVYYVEKDQDIVLSYFRNDSDGPVSFEIRPLETQLVLGENTFHKETDGKIYAKFTPNVSGAYTITMPQEIDYSPLFFNVNGYSLSPMNHGSGEKDYTYSLTGGQTYILYFNFRYTSLSEVALTFAQTPPPVLKLGPNTIPVDGSAKGFTFTPDESGMYQIYNESYVSLAVYQGSKSLYESELRISDYDSEFESSTIKLSAGQQYTIVPNLDYYSGETLYIYVEKVPDLTSGESEIGKCGLITMATFTPEKTGIYVFSCQDGSVDYPYYMQDSYYTNVLNRRAENGKCAVLLEKDVEYVLSFRAASTHEADTLSVNIEEQRVLKMGNNEDVLVVMPNDGLSQYTYYTFIPEKSGTYTFRTENGESVSAYIYEKFNSDKEIGRGTASYVTKNLKMTATLEAGSVYQVAMYYESYEEQEQDVYVRLIVEETPASKLAGYSLSLDGTIAINLYLSLADFVATSDTAVLQYTRADGKVIRYDMTEAETKMLNNQKYYVFHLPVSAKEMSSRVYAQIIDEEKEYTGDRYSLSVVEYANTILNGAYDNDGNVKNQAYADACPLVKALLNYGARAQAYFNVNIYQPANMNLTVQERNLGAINPDSIPKYVRSAQSENLPDGLTFEGAALSLESETELLLYFTNKTGKSVVYSEPSRGLETKGKMSEEYTVVRIKGIPAHKLDKDIRLEISVPGDDGTYFVCYSPIYYCHNVIKRGETEPSEARPETLIDLMRAFYFYNQAAKNYIGE